MKLSIRSYQSEVHDRLLAAVKRVMYAECGASGSLKVHEPTFTTIMLAPATIDDSKSAEILKTDFKGYLRTECHRLGPLLARVRISPFWRRMCYIYMAVSMQRDEAVKAGKVNEIPQNHSAFFAPVAQPTMTTAVDAFALAASTFLGKPS